MNENAKGRNRLIRRIFLLQLAMVIITCVAVWLAIQYKSGSFWFAFIAGVFGASIALLRNVTTGEIRDGYLFDDDWILTLSPFLYGGILAGVAYFLMVSKLVSGDSGGGLITSNLFPNFNGDVIPEGGQVEMADFLSMRPATLADTAKLLIWCLLAGFSENFVTGILSSLEAHGSLPARGQSTDAVQEYQPGIREATITENMLPLEDDEMPARPVDDYGGFDDEEFGN